MILWRKLILQRFTQLSTNKPVIITVLPVARFFVIHAITLLRGLQRF
jgi:hypothetical protein